MWTQIVNRLAAHTRFSKSGHLFLEAKPLALSSVAEASKLLSKTPNLSCEPPYVNGAYGGAVPLQSGGSPDANCQLPTVPIPILHNELIASLKDPGFTHNLPAPSLREVVLSRVTAAAIIR